MPLANPSVSTQGWLEQRERELQDFSGQIESRIENKDWEGLQAILKARQIYFERQQSSPIPPLCVTGFKGLIQQVLSQDQAFQMRIQQIRDELKVEQQSFERGKQALHAYNGR